MKKLCILMLSGIIGISTGIGMGYMRVEREPKVQEEEMVIEKPRVEKEKPIVEYEQPEELSLLWQPSEVIEEVKQEVQQQEEVQEEIVYEDPKPVVKEPVKEMQTSIPDNTYAPVTSLAGGEFYINVPKINITNFWVSRGIGDEQAQLAVGGSLLNGTPYPNRYEGNAVIGAHREWTNGWNPFYYINHLVKGDLIEVHINNEVLVYEVFDSYVIHETSIGVVTQEFGYPVLTLYSCTLPTSENRYVLHAKLKN